MWTGSAGFELNEICSDIKSETSIVRSAASRRLNTSRETIICVSLMNSGEYYEHPGPQLHGHVRADPPDAGKPEFEASVHTGPEMKPRWTHVSEIYLTSFYKMRIFQIRGLSLFVSTYGKYNYDEKHQEVRYKNR